MRIKALSESCDGQKFDDHQVFVQASFRIQQIAQIVVKYIMKYLFWILFLMSAVAFFTPLQVQENTGLGLDKIVHIGLFAVLTLLGVLSYKKAAMPVILLLFFYVFASELIQKNYIPHRSFDVYDILADCVGVVLGLLIISGFRLPPEAGRRRPE